MTPRTDATEAEAKAVIGAHDCDAILREQCAWKWARDLERELRAMTDYAELASDVLKRARVLGERP